MIKADPKAPFAGLAFKIINDKYGTLTFVRVYAGTLKSGDMVMNTTKGHRERIGRMFQMHADKRAEIKEVEAGDIAAFVGLKDTGTGDTLASADDPVMLERMAFPVPVIDISVEPRTKEAVEKMTHRPAEAGRPKTLACACAPTRKPARPSCPAWASCTWRSSSTGCAANTAWKATSARRRSRIARRSAGRTPKPILTRSRPVARASTPRSRSSSSRWSGTPAWCSKTRSSAASVPKEYIPAVEKGIRVQADTGVLAGFPTVDFKYTLIDGKYHDVELVGAGVRNRRQGLLPRRHEEGRRRSSWSRSWTWKSPRRRITWATWSATSIAAAGMIQNQESSGSTVIVRAHVPLKEMFGYISHLRSMTKGRASFTMQFHHYDPVPRNIADEIMAKSA